MRSAKSASKLAFGLYEVDLSTGEIWRGGHRIKLQSQPFKVLTVLLEHAGEVVTREELQLRLWGNDTIVDFDHSLATAINKIREALRDSAENPRFVETLARRGYRFIAPVTIAGTDVPAGAAFGPVSDADADTDDESSAPNENGNTNGAGSITAPESSVEVPSVEAHILRSEVAIAEPAARPAAKSATKAGTNVEAASEAVPRRWPLLAAGIGVLACAAGALGGYVFGERHAGAAPGPIVQLTENGHLAVGNSLTESFTGSATDGYRLFVPVLEGGKSAIATVPVSGGPPVNLSVPDEVQAPTMGDISPDGSKLLLRNHLSPESEQPLWVVPTSGGSALRVGAVLAHDATWMPSSGAPGTILYAAGNDLWVTDGGAGKPEHYASLPGRAFWLRWNPAGTLLRFTVVDPIAHTESLWQLRAGDRKPEPVLVGFSEPESECCGVWTADGKAYVFQSDRGGNTDLWRLSGNGTGNGIGNPVRLTYGPLEFQSPVAARSNGRSGGGNTVYFIGVDVRSEVERLTSRDGSGGGTLVVERGFLAGATRVAFSRDKKWVAWTDSAGRLWRAASDGTQKIQLTPDGFNVFVASWSPDGARLAIMAREPGKAWQIYLVAAGGGDVLPVLKELRNSADPSWSADGQKLVYGRVNDALGKESGERTLHILDLKSDLKSDAKSGQGEQIPGSEGLFSPRWSPDGKYIAALTLDQRQVRLYDVAAKTWKTLSVDSGADPVWSSDSRYLYVHRSMDPAQPIVRIAIPSGAVQELIKLAGSSEGDAVDYVFVGLTADDVPLIRVRTSTGNVYSTVVR